MPTARSRSGTAWSTRSSSDVLGGSRTDSRGGSFGSLKVTAHRSQRSCGPPVPRLIRQAKSFVYPTATARTDASSRKRSSTSGPTSFSSPRRSRRALANAYDSRRDAAHIRHAGRHGLASLLVRSSPQAGKPTLFEQVIGLLPLAVTCLRSHERRSFPLVNARIGSWRGNLGLTLTDRSAVYAPRVTIPSRVRA